MRVTKKIPYALRNAALTAALAAIGLPASATLVADGKLGDAAVASPASTAAAALAEGYQFGYSVGFVDDKGNSMGNGQIWFGTAADGTQFLYVLEPLGFVDNTYGTNAAADWTKGHTFSDLLGSDSEGATVGFSWTDAKNSGKTTTGSIDYIAGCSADTAAGAKAVCSVPSPGTGGYASGGLGTTGTGITDGGNGSSSKWTNVDTKTALTGSASSLLQVATSLEYDLKNVDPTATTNSSTLPGWVKEVGYEYQFAAGTFDPAIWGDGNPADGHTGVVTINSATGTPQFGTAQAPGLLQIGDFHVSPPKANLGSFTPPCLIGSASCAAPEPGSLALIASGLAAVGWYTRRRKTDAGPRPLAAIVST